MGGSPVIETSKVRHRRIDSWVSFRKKHLFYINIVCQLTILNARIVVVDAIMFMQRCFTRNTSFSLYLSQLLILLLLNTGLFSRLIINIHCLVCQWRNATKSAYYNDMTIYIVVSFVN